jgi:hypothetical protein
MRLSLLTCRTWSLWKCPKESSGLIPHIPIEEAFILMSKIVCIKRGVQIIYSPLPVERSFAWPILLIVSQVHKSQIPVFVQTSGTSIVLNDRERWYPRSFFDALQNKKTRTIYQKLDSSGCNPSTQSPAAVIPLHQLSRQRHGHGKAPFRHSRVTTHCGNSDFDHVCGALQ